MGKEKAAKGRSGEEAEKKTEGKREEAGEEGGDGSSPTLWRKPGDILCIRRSRIIRLFSAEFIQFIRQQDFAKAMSKHLPTDPIKQALP